MPGLATDLVNHRVRFENLHPSESDVTRTSNSLILKKNSLFPEIFSLLSCVGNCREKSLQRSHFSVRWGSRSLKIAKFPVKFPVSRELAGDRCDQHSRPSQGFGRPAKLPRKSENGPEIPAFRPFDFVSGLPNRLSRGANRRKSPATPLNIPVLQKLSAETGLGHDCRRRAAVDLAY
jgi:hypothetical protein